MKRILIATTIAMTLLAGCADDNSTKDEVKVEKKEVSSDDKKIDKVFVNYEKQFVSENAQTSLSDVVANSGLSGYLEFYQGYLSELKEKDPNKTLTQDFKIESREQIAKKDNYAAYRVDERIKYETSEMNVEYVDSVYYVVRKEDDEWKLLDRLPINTVVSEKQVLSPYLTNVEK